MDNWCNILDEGILKYNVSFASMFVLNYECLKEYVIGQIREFYSENIHFEDDKMVCEESLSYGMKVEAINRKEDINMKKKCLIIGLLVVVMITILVIVLKFGLKKEKPITDIKVNGNEIELDINRKFFLYDEDPLETEKEKIEPLKEVEVVIKGKGNCNNNKFEGEVKVEGFELGGNFQSFNISREENGYEMTCMSVNLQNEEAVDGPLYYYWITISDDFKLIHIWITEYGKNESDDYHWVMNSGY